MYESNCGSPSGAIAQSIGVNAAKQESPLECAIRALDKQQSETFMLLDDLRSRLNPVLSSEVPQQDKNEARPLMATPLLEAVENRNEAQSEINARLRILLGRVVL